MNNLENKIIKKIYGLETEKTLYQVISKIISVILISLTSIFIFSIIVEILNDQSSFDLFDFLRDDISTIKENLFNNSLLFIQELPLPLIYIFFGLLLLLLWIIFIIIKSKNKINNKLRSLYKFWIR